mgnify:CR=1 FL=1
MTRKITLLAFIIVFSVAGYSQSQRFILMEEATNASCPPCATYNPAFDALLNANRDKLTAIKYHSWWPGTDPMYSQNPEDNADRINYYNINSVPRGVMDGTTGSLPSFNQTMINQRSAVPSPLDIWMSHQLSADEDSIYINMMIQASDNVSGDLMARMAVIEKEINFPNPPGSNGEKDFLDVMKKMVPDADGTHLAGTMETGDYLIIQGSWELANIYDMAHLAVVGFVQDDNNREVHQAANSSEDPLTPLYDKEIAVMEISNVSETNCLGITTPHVKIRNNGGETLTSAMFRYRVNDGELHEYSWTGSLDFLESEIVELPEISFGVEDENELKIFTEMPNGSPDEYTKNDTSTYEFDRAVIAPEIIDRMIRTDDNPEEITWEIVNSGNEVIESGGPYSDPQTIIQEEIVLPYYDCFKFTIYDAGGNGLQMPGFYALYFGGSNYIASGTEFGAEDMAYFEGNTAVNIPEYNSDINLKIYPNPVTSSVHVDFFLEKNANAAIRVYSLMGKEIKTLHSGSLTAGPHSLTQDLTMLPAGIYFIKIDLGSKVFTEKIAIN